ncbi:TfuA domain-containing protein [Gloeobacter violaceus]|uniref:Gll1298 protein n=1 Tax=Gloeobacter violaceus (strain ATCC 29082 / PCC 7421) TaxID=251221 RepID=Q7NL28_GLOVI|nr:TfuA domain-containing protein [Gloeobacter violaceus]BAC89239.1 gll1298 [Gloeobacter violaceus PCC 7421]
MPDFMNNCTFFVGPTLQGIEPLKHLRLDVTCLPPVRRGDVEALTSQSPPGHLVIVDGIFHQFPSVGHIELRTALKKGWRVWGLCSMGAIRACEMRDLGMRGYGTVYERFVQDEDFTDDEVALLHGPAHPYPSITEPLIHMRFALDDLVTRGGLSRREAAAVVEHLSRLWFGYRTLALLRQLVLECRPQMETGIVDTWLANFEPFRIKSWDLWKFLQERPWQKRD